MAKPDELRRQLTQQLLHVEQAGYKAAAVQQAGVKAGYRGDQASWDSRAEQARDFAVCDCTAAGVIHDARNCEARIAEARKAGAGITEARYSATGVAGGADARVRGSRIPEARVEVARISVACVEDSRIPEPCVAAAPVSQSRVQLARVEESGIEPVRVAEAEVCLARIPEADVPDSRVAVGAWAASKALTTARACEAAAVACAAAEFSHPVYGAAAAAIAADAWPCQASPANPDVTDPNDDAAVPSSEANPSQADAASSIGADPAPTNSSKELISGGNTMKLIRPIPSARLRTTTGTLGPGGHRVSIFGKFGG